MKKYIYIIVLACIVNACSISNGVDSAVEEKSEYDIVVEQINALNREYFKDSTKAGWWRRVLLLAVADAGVFIGTHDISASISASTLAWTVSATIFEDDGGNSGPVTQVNGPRDDGSEGSGLDITDGTGSNVGEIHNTVILELYDEYGDALCSMPTFEVMNLVAGKVADLTDTAPNMVYAEVSGAVGEMEAYTDLYLNSSNIDEYIDGLIEMHPEAAAELEVLRPTLEGFQFVDPETDDGDYGRELIEIIDGSGLGPRSKTNLKAGISIANASVKLWGDVEQN